MKYICLFLLAITSIQCNRHSANKSFDLKINIDIGKYKYTCHPVTDADFHALKSAISENWPQQLLTARRTTVDSVPESSQANLSRYTIPEYIAIVNEMETFTKHLTTPTAYLKSTAASQEIAVLEYNKVFAPLPDECLGDPVNYSDHIMTAVKDILADNHLKLELCYGFKQLTSLDTKYTIYAKLGDQLHTITFTNRDGCMPDNHAVYLLLNKILMSTEIKERLVKYSDHNSLIFVQPARYERLLRRLAQP